MTVQLNHTIVHTNDQAGAATWFAEVFGRPAPTRFGPFLVVEVDNGVSLDFDTEMGGPVEMQHYAFLVDDDDFDAIFGRIQARGVPYYADPGCREAGAINHHDGGRGVYFPSHPDGHLLEIITKPYGSGG